MPRPSHARLLLLPLLVAVSCCVGGCATDWQKVENDPINLEALSAALEQAAQHGDDIEVEDDRRKSNSPEDVVTTGGEHSGGVRHLSAEDGEEPGERVADADDDSVPEGVWRKLDEAWDWDTHNDLEASLHDESSEQGDMPASNTPADSSARRSFGSRPTVPAGARVLPARAPPQMQAPAVAKLPTPPKATRGPDPKTLSDLDRERTHYLRNTTTVVGRVITLHVPASYAHRVQWVEGTPRDIGGGRRRAEGSVLVRLTNLTLRGASITVHVREDVDANLQITARGSAGVVTRVDDTVIREEGLRTLVITNDRVVPIR